MSPALEVGSLPLAPPGKPPSSISRSNSCVPSLLLLLVFDYLCCQFPGLIPEVNSGVSVVSATLASWLFLNLQTNIGSQVLAELWT